MTLETTFQRILDHTNGGKNCPAHEDKNPSLSVTLKTDKRKILIKCHAGCSFDSILSALNLNASDLFEKSRNNPKSERCEVARYRYEDEDNEHLFDVVRFELRIFASKQLMELGILRMSKRCHSICHYLKHQFCLKKHY